MEDIQLVISDLVKYSKAYLYCICFDGVVIAAQYTEPFLRSIVVPRIWVLGREYAN